MGWFVLAIIGGFAGYWARDHIPYRQVCGLAIILMVCALIWLLALGEPGTFGRWISAISDGRTARFLLGIVLGVLAAYVFERQQVARAQADAIRAAVEKGVRDALASRVTDEAAAAAAGDAGKTAAATADSGMLPFLMLGAVVVVLALVAPFVDKWLNNVTGLKTALIEIQVANVSNAAKTVEPGQRDALYEVTGTQLLGQFAASVNRDIQFVSLFAIPDLRDDPKTNSFDEAKSKREIATLTAQQAQLVQLQGLFEQMVSPIARCIDLAVGNGFDLAAVQAMLRPVAGQLREIRLGEQRLEKLTELGDRQALATELDQARRDFLDGLRAIPPRLLRFVGPTGQADCTTSIASDDLPAASEFKTLPHLFTAMAVLFAFVKNDDVALQTLLDAEPALDFADLNEPFFKAQLMYYRHEPVSRYLGVLDRMRTVAHQREALIERVLARCGDHCSPEVKNWAPKLLQRERLGNLFAINFAAYAITSDVAEGLRSAESRFPIALQLADEIEKLMQDDTRLKIEDKGVYLDTAAFVHIVEEARKPIRDTDHIRAIVAKLEAIVARQVGALPEAGFTSRRDAAILAIYRAHLTAARRLLE